MFYFKLVRAVLKIGLYHLESSIPTPAYVPFPDDVIISGQTED